MIFSGITVTIQSLLQSILFCRAPLKMNSAETENAQRLLHQVPIVQGYRISIVTHKCCMIDYHQCKDTTHQTQKEHANKQTI